MALALCAAFGVRVCSPANAVAKRYPGPSDLCVQWPASKTLGSRFRGNDDGIFAATPPRHRRLAFDRHPGIAKRYPGPIAFCVAFDRHPGAGRDPVSFCSNNLHQRHWIPAFAGMTKGYIFAANAAAALKRPVLIVIPAQARIHCAFEAKSKWVPGSARIKRGRPRDDEQKLVAPLILLPLQGGGWEADGCACPITNGSTPPLVGSIQPIPTQPSP